MRKIDLWGVAAELEKVTARCAANWVTVCLGSYIATLFSLNPTLRGGLAPFVSKGMAGGGGGPMARSGGSWASAWRPPGGCVSVSSGAWWLALTFIPLPPSEVGDAGGCDDLFFLFFFLRSFW